MQVDMFLKNNPTAPVPTAGGKKESTPSIITRDMHMLGNIISDGVVDFDGTLDGNIRCNIFTLRSTGAVKGEIVAGTVYIYGKVKGLIRAKNVHLYTSCNVEGIIMHEAITIEDGAFVDGKFKRTDRVLTDAEEEESGATAATGDDDTAPETKILENIRLIR
jgi:cytoskeletal protein CcmA (bactofilin family)